MAIKGVPVTANKTMHGDWDEDCSIEVRSFTRRDLKTIASEIKARKQSNQLRKKKGQAEVTEEDAEIALLDFCLIGWKGLTYKQLAEMTEGFQYTESPETVFDFTPENKAHLFQYMTLEFGTFLDKLIALAGECGQESEKN